MTKLRCVWPFLPPLLFLAFIEGSPPHMKSDQIIHVPTLQGPHPTKSVVKWCHLPHSACLPCLPPCHGGAHTEVSARRRLHGGVCTDISGQRCLHGDVFTEMSARRCLHGGVCTDVLAPTCLYGAVSAEMSARRCLRGDVRAKIYACIAIYMATCIHVYAYTYMHLYTAIAPQPVAGLLRLCSCCCLRLAARTSACRGVSQWDTMHHHTHAHMHICT